MKQATIASETVIDGIGLHTGESARVRFRPGEVDTGIRFRRTDLAGEPEIEVDLEHVASTERGTSLATGDARVQTVEHVLAAVVARDIDNVCIEVDGPELPIGDGSFEPFHEQLVEAGRVEQSSPAAVLELPGPVHARVDTGASYTAVPCDQLRISATIEFAHSLIDRQYASFDVTGGTFARDLSRARTFGFLSEAEALHARGLALGATPDNAIILDEEGLASGELRYPDEFVRHKIGDIVGDLALLGRRLRAHVVADRPSHAGNLELARKLLNKAVKTESNQPVIDIREIMEHLQHRYPMLLVDRIVEFEPRKRIVGIKNVTINEPFFQGHFPGHPVMPGVLIIEAMAQVGGMMLMDTVDQPEDKVVYFMALDNVRWRRPVTPGDQIRFELHMIQLRRRVCRMRGIGTVDGQVVAEADMMARIMER